MVNFRFRPFKEVQKHVEESDDESESGRIRFVFAGYQDGSIRKWDLKNGNCTLHIEKETKKASQKQGQCLIWCLKLYKS